MKNRLLKIVYHKITLNNMEIASKGKLKTTSSNGVIRIGYRDSQVPSLAVSPIILNRATKRNIKKVEIAK